MEYKKVEKPSDWGKNNREINLDIIYKQVQNFIENPTYLNKELLFSTLNATDMNEINELGEVHICDYEIALMNALYETAICLNCSSLKTYLYGHISRYTRFYRMFRNMSNSVLGEDVPFIINEYLGLVAPLRLFYTCYADYDRRKNRTFVDSIIDTVKSVINSVQDLKIQQDCLVAYNLMLQDLSFANSNQIYSFACFNRDELKRLFELSAFLNKKLNQKVTQRPLKGVIKLSLSQWILKSRNDYDADNLYKSISISNSLKAFSNHEVWMSKTTKLNDKREQKVIKGLFNNKTWLKFDWAKKVKIRELSNSFVCSFSKAFPSEKVQKRYGGVIFGYKSDRIIDILTPIEMITVKGQKFPRFAQVAFYDIIYEETVAREELNYLCEIIDAYDLTDNEKGEFLDELLEYWYLSFKDNKWVEEQERRYQLFVCDDNYYDLLIENDFLKIKSTLYLYPDFIISDNETIRIKGKYRRLEKLSATATKNYVFCENCFQADFSAGNYTSLPYKECPICGSTHLLHKEITIN